MVSERTYEITCRATLTDREVDALADLLWDNGAGTICFRPLEHYSRADSTSDRDALAAANQHDVARSLKW